MEKKNLKKGALAAGGVALVAAAAALCVKGMKAVDKKMKAKREVQDFDEETFEMADAVAEETVEEAAVEETAAEEPAAEAPAEEENAAE